MITILENKTNVICAIYIKNLIKAKKGSRVFYDTFVGVNEYIPQGKWQAEIGNISENEWNDLSLEDRNILFSFSGKNELVNSKVLYLSKQVYLKEY